MQIKDIMKIDDYKAQIEELQKANAALVRKLDALEGENYFSIQGKVNQLNNCYDQRFHESRTLSSQIREQFEKTKELDKQIAIKQKTLIRMKELYQAMVSSIENYINTPLEYENCKLSDKYISECERLTPTINLNLADMDSLTLQQTYIEKEQIIDALFKQYDNNHTSSADKALYELTNLSIKAEMQNILYSIKPSQLDEAIELIKNVCKKNLRIVCDGNAGLAGNYTKLIGELEYHYTELAKTKHEYLLKQNI